MHKAVFVEGTLRLTIEPHGPILIKAGESGGADPTLPDMEFVRSREKVYLPGASLKGVVRAQCERICRSMDGPQRYDAAQQRTSDTFIPPLADNPLIGNQEYKPYAKGGNDMAFSSSVYFNNNKAEDTPTIYRHSSFTSRLFGHTSLAGRVRFADAYPRAETSVETEERNGVAIDRIYGSVAVGPFNYETVVAGVFETRIDFKNVTLAQLGLLGLALRDLAEGRIAIGFGKSRGLGRVKVTFTQMNISYPTCELTKDGALQRIGGTALPAGHFAGLGVLCQDQAFKGYGLPEQDSAELQGITIHDKPLEEAAVNDNETFPNPFASLSDGLHFVPDAFLGAHLVARGATSVREVWRACMPAWKRELGLVQ